jgi:hypothetical protein
MSEYYNPTAEGMAERRQALQEFDMWNRRALMSIWSLIGRPETYIDFGSGSGAMVRLARSCGVSAVGVDIIAEPPDFAHDLREPLQLGRKFQLATSIEVAEHLPADAASVFCKTVVEHLIDNGGWFIFTAALPGQPGYHHVNLIPPFEWREKLSDAGLTYHETATIKLALLWTQTTGSLHHLPANLQVFVKGEPLL